MQTSEDQSVTEKATLSSRMAEYIDSTTFEKLEPAVVQKAKEVILYHLALAIRCRRDELSMGAQAAKIARRLSPQGGSATLIGYRERALPIDAAFVNASQMRAHELDDVIFPAGIHAGLVTIPIALALAEDRGRSGRDVLSAVVVAYEVMGKLGTFTWDSESPRRPTMAYGTFGSVIAAGRMLGLTREQFQHAMSYAVHSAQGVGQGDDETGPPTHYYSLLGRAGIVGAIAAQEGGLGSPHVMEGRFGFFDTFTPGKAFDADKYIASLGHDYQIMTSVEKRYQGTGLNIVGIELLREIVKTGKLEPDLVRVVRFMVPDERRNFAGGHSSAPITSADQANGSVTYHMAMMLLDGEIDFRRYAEFATPHMQAAIAKIKPMLVPGKSNIRWSRVEVELVDGRVLAREGETYTFPPLSPHERLVAAVGDFLPRAQVDRCHELIMGLDKQSTVGPMMSCLVPPA
jgi:2-methylcitrate dehydratase PrpD